MWRRGLASILSSALVCVFFTAVLAADKKEKPKPAKKAVKAAPKKVAAKKVAPKKTEAKKIEAKKDEGKKAAECETKAIKALEINLKNKRRVYYGKLNSVTDLAKIRVLVVRKVFSFIRHYRRIKSDRIPHGSARYWIYLARANRSFKAAVNKNALEMKLQLIVEKGNIKTINKKPLPEKAEDKMDVTDKVVKSVRALPRG